MGTLSAQLQQIPIANSTHKSCKEEKKNPKPQSVTYEMEELLEVSHSKPLALDGSLVGSASWGVSYFCISRTASGTDRNLQDAFQQQT